MTALVIVEVSLLLVIFAVYFAAGIAARRAAFPALSLTSRRLASVFLLLPPLLILLYALTSSATGLQRWLWHLDKEWNLPSALSSTQFALAGCVALSVALRRRGWLRLYFLGMAAVLFFFAYDEFFNFHDFVLDWQLKYMLIAAGIGASTALAAWRTQGRARRWHALLLGGFIVGALGSIYVDDSYAHDCGGYGFVYLLDGCLDVIPLEEALEFLGIWLVLLALLGQLSLVGAPRRLEKALLAAPALWIVFLLLGNAVPPVARHFYGSSASVQYKSGAELHGYHSARDGTALSVSLFLSPRGWHFERLGYSLSLLPIDSQEVLASLDIDTTEALDFIPAPGFRPVYRQWSPLQIPPGTPGNQGLRLALSLWREQDGKFIRERIRASDLPLLSETQLILQEFVLEDDAPAPPLTAPPQAVYDNGLTLEAVALPALARAGESLPLRFAWRAADDAAEDLIQFLHFGHIESGDWWVYDQQPLGDRLPTRLWYEGLAAAEIWQVPLPQDLAAGEYAVFTGLYRLRDKERLPVRAADGSAFTDFRAPLGTLQLLSGA